MTWETQRAFKTKLMTWEILRAFLTKYGMKTQCAFITKPVTWKLQGLSSLNMAWKLKTAFLIKHGTKTLRPSSLRTTRATFTQVSASTTGSFDTHTHKPWCLKIITIKDQAKNQALNPPPPCDLGTEPHPHPPKKTWEPETKEKGEEVSAPTGIQPHHLSTANNLLTSPHHFHRDQQTD